MKMMGLNNAVHWVAWFITGFVQLSISVTALTAILKYGRVLLHSDPFIIWLFLTIYAVATIMFWYDQLLNNISVSFFFYQWLIFGDGDYCNEEEKWHFLEHIYQN